MASLMLEIWAAFAILFLAVDANIPGYTKSNGHTRLLGSSFGVAGVNATFDFVVCT